MTGSFPAKSTDPDRLGIRLSADLKQKVKYAAQLKGVPAAGYIKAVLADAVAKDIQEHEFIDLTLRDRQAFVQAILNPPKPSKQSIKAAKRYKEKFGL